MDLPGLVARPGKFTPDHTVSSMETHQFRNDAFVKQIRYIPLLLIAEAGLCLFRPVVAGHGFYLVGPGISRVMQELPEAQDLAVTLGFSPAPRAMTWVVLLTTRSRDRPLQSGHSISTRSSELKKIFSKTFPQVPHLNSNIGILALLSSMLQHYPIRWYSNTETFKIKVRTWNDPFFSSLLYGRCTNYPGSPQARFNRPFPDSGGGGGHPSPNLLSCALQGLQGFFRFSFSQL